MFSNATGDQVNRPLGMVRHPPLGTPAAVPDLGGRVVEVWERLSAVHVVHVDLVVRALLVATLLTTLLCASWQQRR